MNYSSMPERREGPGSPMPKAPSVTGQRTPFLSDHQPMTMPPMPVPVMLAA